jgi:acyl carrier protein
MTIVSMEEVQRLIRLQLGTKSVRPSDRLAEDLGAESADVANIVAAAEERFGAEIAEEEIARIVTVSDLFDVIMRHCSGG